jgi:glycosyltransferase involved in cell wall biosynthesis
MTNGKYRVLIVYTHPIQYAVPLVRRLADHPELDVLVAYCSLQGTENSIDSEMGVPVSWDIPLLEGYRWVHVPNRSPRPGVGFLFGLINPGLWTLIGRGKFDVVITFMGYFHFSFWILALATKWNRTPLILGTDATTLVSKVGSRWKSWVKPMVVPRLFGISNVVMVGAEAGREFMRGLGLPEERIVLAPSVVNNDWWLEKSAAVDREAVRAGWGIPKSALVVLFCAKLQAWKRPGDLLKAFARANVPGTYLVMAGDGPLRSLLQEEAEALGVSDRVRWLGFVNQSGLPAVYSASDLFVLPSDHDPGPFVVCEAMLCGCAVILSDRITGRLELVKHGQTGFVFPCGDVEELAAILRDALSDPLRLQEMGAAARKRMEFWSPREHVQGVLRAIETATAPNKAASSVDGREA